MKRQEIKKKFWKIDKDTRDGLKLVFTTFLHKDRSSFLNY